MVSFEGSAHYQYILIMTEGSYLNSIWLPLVLQINVPTPWYHDLKPIRHDRPCVGYRLESYVTQIPKWTKAVIFLSDLKGVQVQTLTQPQTPTNMHPQLQNCTITSTHGRFPHQARIVMSTPVWELASLWLGSIVQLVSCEPACKRKYFLLNEHKLYIFLHSFVYALCTF